MTRPFTNTDADRFGAMQIIPVPPDHEHYPPEPNTFLLNDSKSRAYVRSDEWPRLRAELLKVTAPEMTGYFWKTCGIFGNRTQRQELSA
jgi:hypothetical protein